MAQQKKRKQTSAAAPVQDATKPAESALGVAPPPAAPEAPPPASAGRQQPSDERRCPYHKNVKLTANRSEPFFTRYYCPVDGCTYSEKVPRPDIKQRAQQAQDAEQDYSAR